MKLNLRCLSSDIQRIAIADFALTKPMPKLFYTFYCSEQTAKDFRFFVRFGGFGVQQGSFSHHCAPPQNLKKFLFLY